MGEKYEVRKKSDGGYTVEQVPGTAEQIGGGIALIYIFRWPLAILFVLGGSIIVCVGIYQLITMPFTAKPPAKTVLQQSTAAGISVIATVAPNGALSQAAAQEPTQAITAPISGRITQNVKLHSKPGIDEPTITVLKAGTEVVLTGDSVTTADGITWNKVQVGQQEGWCSAMYIAASNQAPTSVPTPLLPPAPLFEYPVDGQTLDFEGAYLFKVRPVDDADGYKWSFSQGGVTVWEDQQDKSRGSPNEYGIQVGNPVHDKFMAGDIQVSVRVMKGGLSSNPTIITVHLRPRTS